ncbi:uncharacterized protein LOC141902392 isoform X2 [Tubulanus polymorphus]|uniref:uncharacterized protein LOC141902392 isoform X2 n=1 Tax=Tubulanus polymorphus TaxID=672921 RepID=UPI003DA45AC1
MSLDLYQKIKVIGKGSYGQVWLSKHRKDRKQYVLKKIDLQNASKRERKAAEQEVKLLSRLKHPNIVAYKDSFECDDGYLYIAMGYCEGGDLYNRLKEQKGVPLEERQVVEWFVQIAMALQYMHERNILHRDLKTQNIFLTKSKIIKVGDLGIARVLEGTNDMATTLIGTPYYMSPELFSNKPYNHKSDVWALGCCVYEMSTLKHAFNAKDMNSLVYKILKGKMPSMPKQYSPELLDLIKAMLNQHPEKRPSVNRILRDNYIKRNIAIFLEGTKRRRSSSSSSVASSRPNSSSGRLSSGRPPTVDRSSGRPTSESRNQEVSRSESAKSVNRDSSSNNNNDSKNGVKAVVVDPQQQQVRAIMTPIKEMSAKSAAVSNASNVSNEAPKPPPSPKVETPPAKVSPSPIPAKAEPRRRRRIKESDSESVATCSSEVTESEEPSSARSSASIFDNPKPVSKPRPLPPRPSSAGNLGRDSEKTPSEGSTSSGSVASSCSKDEVSKSMGDVPETPRNRPNSAARARRRQRLQTEGETPRTPSAVSGGECKELIVNKPREVEKNVVTKSEPVKMRQKRNQRHSPIKHRQPSIPSCSSSSTESESENTDKQQPVNKNNNKVCNDPQKPDQHQHHHRKDKEMNNFITLLDTTLRLNRAEDKSDDDSDDVVIPASARKSIESRRNSVPVNSAAAGAMGVTMGATGRLMERIGVLRKDCIRGLGVERLKRAYDILDNIDGDELEPHLLALLGQEYFDEYAGKIWQLKFCEEAAFGRK